MPRANPFQFVKALETFDVELSPTNLDEKNLAKRPKRLFKRLERQGYTIEATKPDAAMIKSYGFNPMTVIDVGVDFGTPMIYDAFPDAKFILVDPVAESEQKVQIWKDKIDYDFHCCALGAKAGKIDLHIPSTTAKVRHSRASVLEFSDGNKDQFSTFETRVVPVKTLDTLTKKIKGPIGLKIDTEGFELEVIKGAKQTLKQTEFVIAEGSIKKRYIGGYRFSDLVAEMGKNGFEILEFLRPIRLDASDCDVLFARYDSGRFEFL